MPHSDGPPCLSSGWKLHCTGSLRSSTAAIMVATWAQSAAAIVWSGSGAGASVSSGDPAVLRPSTVSPTRSAQEAVSASAWSAKSVVGVWYTDWARQ